MSFIYLSNISSLLQYIECIKVAVNVFLWNAARKVLREWIMSSKRVEYDENVANLKIKYSFIRQWYQILDLDLSNSLAQNEHQNWTEKLISKLGRKNWKNSKVLHILI